MSPNSAKKTRVPRTPYVPPAARRSANAGNNAPDNLSCRQDDSNIGQSRRPSAVGEEGARRLRDANEPGQRAGVVRASRSPGKGKASSQHQKRRLENEQDKSREQEPRGEFQQQCSAKPASGSNTDTCHEQLLVPALDATNTTEATRAPAAGAERARGETDACAGKGRRKPRQAWSQYVPPKRRGSPSSGAAAEQAQPRKQPSPAETNAASRVENNIDRAPSESSLQSTSSPGDSCSTVGEEAPTLAKSKSLPEAGSSELTSDAPDRGAPILGEGDGGIKSDDPSRVVAHGTTVMGATVAGVDHQQRCDDRSAEMERAAAESQLMAHAEGTAASPVPEAHSGLPAVHARAAGSLLDRSEDECSMDAGALRNEQGARESERAASGCPCKANTLTSSEDSMPTTMAEEAEVPSRSTPAPSPIQPSACNSSGNSSSGSENTPGKNSAPTSQEARNHQAGTESVAPTTPGKEDEAGQTQPPPELGGDTSGGNAAAAASEEKRNGDSPGLLASQELPVAKAPSARYVPPGRRKIIDAEVAALNETGASETARGMGPLWTSRAPVRVSQRARPSDRESSPVRPSPARVAGVVSGGMSAYGANISEYSELMSRDQVEACTAVVSNFPSALPPGQRDLMLQPFVALGGLVVWPRPDEALVTFATPALARQAVSNRHTRSSVLLVEALSEAREEKRRGYRRVELARPGRPPADASSASRLISGALGIRRPRAKPSTTPARKGTASNGGVRGRGAKTALAQPAESTDSWDM
eukprot:jgi/Undpi1/3855/HiC_scaffold_16.g07224.m1